MLYRGFSPSEADCSRLKASLIRDSGVCKVNRPHILKYDIALSGIAADALPDVSLSVLAFESRCHGPALCIGDQRAEVMS